MAWTFVGVSSVVEVTGTTHTLTEPAGVAAGDLLVACISSRIASTTAITLPAGWLLIRSRSVNNVLTTTSAEASGVMAFIVRGASAPDLTFTHPIAPSVAIGRIVAYRGTQSLGLNTSGFNFTSTNITSVNVTGFAPSIGNTLLVSAMLGGQEAAWSAFKTANAPSTASGATDTSTAPSTTTWIERADSNTTTGADTSLAIFDAVKTASATTGNITATATVAAVQTVLSGAFFDLATTADGWSSGERSINTTLSNSDRTVTVSAAVISSVRSTTGWFNGSAGKYYAEFTFASSPNYVGMIPISSGLGAFTNGIYLSVTNGNIFYNVTNIGSVGATPTTSDVICMAWDAGAERVWFRLNGGNWNNSGSADPATNTGGADASAASAEYYALFMYGDTSGDAVTVRTRLAHFTQAVPSGFTSWMGEGGGVTASVSNPALLTVSAGTLDVTTTSPNVTVPLTGHGLVVSAGTLTVTVPGAALWTPAELPTGQVSWFDAADSGTLTFSGSNLTVWTDKSPAANNATPFVTGPTLTSINGLGSLNIAVQPLHTTTAVSLTNFTIFAVFKPDASGNYERLLDNDFANGFWLGRDATSQTWGGGIRLSSPPYGYFVSLADNTTHQIMMRRTSTAQLVRGNGGAVTNSQACDGSATANKVIGIGGSWDNGAPTDGLNNDVVSEVLIYNTSLSSTDYELVEGYLAWKWGIQSSLPIGHTYKSAAPTSGVASVTASVSNPALLTTSAGDLSVSISKIASVDNPALLTTSAGTLDVTAKQNITASVSNPALLTTSAGSLTITTTQSVTANVSNPALLTASAGNLSVTAGGSVSFELTGVEALVSAGTVTVTGKANVTADVTNPALITVSAGTLTVGTPIDVGGDERRIGGGFMLEFARWMG